MELMAEQTLQSLQQRQTMVAQTLQQRWKMALKLWAVGWTLQSCQWKQMVARNRRLLKQLTRTPSRYKEVVEQLSRAPSGTDARLAGAKTSGWTGG